MRATAFVCVNVDDIERVRINNERLSLPIPESVPDPIYEEETAWIHIEDISKAFTRRVNGRRAIHVFMDDGTGMILLHTKMLEDMLDELFLSLPIPDGV